MKRSLTILLAILGAVTLTGVLVMMTRSGSWPASIRALDPRRSHESDIKDDVEIVADEPLA